MTRPAAILSWLMLASCTASAPVDQRACVVDEDCSGGQLCFAEGCGDPGKGIVVEVTGNAQSSQYARDFPVDTGKLGPQFDVSLGDPLSITGQFLIATEPATTAYSLPVVVRAEGKSSLLPGITRTFEARFDKPERGFFEMKVAAGDFKVTATPADKTLPPAATQTTVAPGGEALSLAFKFAGGDGLSVISGQLVRTRDETVVPAETTLIASSFLAKGQEVPVMDLQVIEPTSGELLSQRQAVSITTGEFGIGINPVARMGQTVTLLASPREAGVPVPTKQFTLTNPIPNPVVLELGDFGDAALVRGTILDSAGQPVEGAQVVLSGVVKGDGSFRSKIVVTDAKGLFEVMTLASRNEGSFQLSVVPPREARAAATDRSVTVTITDGVATLSPAEITLPDRVVIHGAVTSPMGLAQPGVAVKATRQLEAAQAIIATEPAETTTSADGTFSLALEPGIWRFEYFPGQMFPIASRLVTIAGANGAGERITDTDLKPVQLSFGRTVSGTVTGNGSRPDQLMPYAQLRFFRVTSVGGLPVSILLGTAITDERGSYSVVLPTAQPQAADGG